MKGRSITASYKINSFPADMTSIILFWLTPDDFTRQRKSSRSPSVKLSEL